MRESDVAEAAHLLYWQIAVMTASERRNSGKLSLVNTGISNNNVHAGPPEGAERRRGSLAQKLARVFSR